jgi:hypothetical protein
VFVIYRLTIYFIVVVKQTKILLRSEFTITACFFRHRGMP